MQNAKDDRNLLKAIEAFGINPSVATVIPISHGLINSTFKVSDENTSFVLQKLNRNVFVSPEDIIQNYNKIYSFLKKGDGYTLPEPIKSIDKNLYYTDSFGHCWRALQFISDTYTPETPKNADDAFAASFCFGNFARSLAAFDAAELNVIIPGFHDLDLRYQQFTDAVKSDLAGRKKKISNEIDELLNRTNLVDFYRQITLDDAYKTRVMHHDAKISNILFDNATNRVVCPVDLDTTQPGYYFSDLGDMIRSMACSHPESSIEFSQLCIRSGFYKAIIDGYLKAMADELTEKEKKDIHYAGLLMIYMQALRFVTDYLNGDTYYRITYPEQNFDRGMNQLILLQKLETFLEKEYRFTK